MMKYKSLKSVVAFFLSLVLVMSMALVAITAYAVGDEDQSIDIDQAELITEDISDIEEEEILVPQQASQKTISAIASDGASVSISGMLPEGVYASITPVVLSAAQLAAYIGADAAKGESVVYDICIMLPDGTEYAPDSTVTVTVTPALPPEAEVSVTHVEDNGVATELESVDNGGGSISFQTDGFSLFIFTVDFHYDNAVYSIQGESSILLSELFQIIGYSTNPASAAESVEFTNYSLISVAKQGDDWRLTSLLPFDTSEKLTVSFSNGDVLEIEVTDANSVQYSIFVGTNIVIHSGLSGFWSSSNTNVATVPRANGILIYDDATVTGKNPGLTQVGNTSMLSGNYYNVYVKAAPTAMTVDIYCSSEGVSDECLDILGINKSTLNNTGYFHAGTCSIPMSYFNGKNIGFKVPLINSNSDWDTVLSSVQNIVPSAENPNNNIAQYLGQVQRDTGYVDGSDKSALFRFRMYDANGNLLQSIIPGEDGSIPYEFNLDLRFATSTVQFKTGNNGISSGDLKDGTTLESRKYITNTPGIRGTNVAAPQGYRIGGFYSTQNFSVGTEIGETVTSPSTADATLTVYIQYVPIDYTITYDYNDGSADADQYYQTYKITDSVTLAAAPVRSGYNFAGWKVIDADPDGDWTVNTPYNASQNIGSGHYGNVTLQAQWEQSTGNLKVQKTVAGNAYIAGQQFTFTVTLKDTNNNPISGTFGENVFVNGQYSFALEGGEEFTLNDLPAGASYTVTESGNDGYTVEKTGDTGTIAAGETKIAAFTNTKNLPIDTGINLDSLPYILILLVVVAGGIAWILVKRRKTHDDRR